MVAILKKKNFLETHEKWKSLLVRAFLDKL